MKKIHFYILSLIIALLCLAGCKVQTVEQYNAQNANEKSVDDSNEKVIPIKEEEKTTKKQKEDSTSNEDQPKTTKTEQKDGQKDKKETNTAQKEINSSLKETNSSKKETVATKKEINKPKKETNQSKKEAQSHKKETVTKKTHISSKTSTSSKDTVREKKKYVTIAVRVDSLLKKANYKKLDASLQNEKYVPKNGVILSTSKYEILSEDDTAWSITLRALKEHNIQFEYEGAGENKYGSVYLQGINHLYEKGAGSHSGWIYNVNGKRPSEGISSYNVKDGDQIVLQYSVEP